MTVNHAMVHIWWQWKIGH